MKPTSPVLTVCPNTYVKTATVCVQALVSKEITFEREKKTTGQGQEER